MTIDDHDYLDDLYEGCEPEAVGPATTVLLCLVLPLVALCVLAAVLALIGVV